MGAFRKSRAFRPAYLVSLGALIAFLFPYLSGPAFCLALLLMPVTMFVLPYSLGERATRHFMINGLAIFVVAVLLIAGLATNSTLTSPPLVLTSAGIAESDAAMILSEGSVEPRNAPASATFTFRVRLTTTNDSRPDNFTVRLELFTIEGLSVSNRSVAMAPYAGQNNTRLGVTYELNETLASAVYVYSFSAQSVQAANRWSLTFRDYAPIVAGWDAFYVFFLYVGATFLLYPLLFYYFFIFMWWYSARMKKSRRRMLEGAELGKAPEPTKIAKPASGATRKASAFTCTACGADVEETDAKCPKCGALFED